MCISAHACAAARVLARDGRSKQFALRSLDRLLREAWKPESGLKHVVAYSDPRRSIATFPACWMITPSPPSLVSTPMKPRPRSATSPSPAASAMP